MRFRSRLALSREQQVQEVLELFRGRRKDREGNEAFSRMDGRG